ncbi:MAG: NPCBM/NEW2 domain-containing protein [Thermoguttaceae bacterium]
MLALLALVGCGLAAWADCPAAELPEAVPVDGQPFRAAVLAIDPGWQITFQCQHERRTLSAAGLVCWGRWVEPGRGPLVLPAEGGLLAADGVEITKGNLIVQSTVFGRLAVPLERLCGVVFQPAADPLERQLLLDRVATAAGQTDRLLLVNQDELAGSIQSLQGHRVHLQAGLGPLDVEVRRVAAIIFNPALLRRQSPPDRAMRAWVGFNDGSRLLAARLLVDEKSVSLGTLGGVSLKTSSNQLAALQPLGGQVVYLSDLKAAGYRHTPFLELSWPYRPDRNVRGGLLRCGGQLYLKGLGMHSKSRLAYQLAEPYRRFQAELAIDDQTGGQGSVLFRVLVDDRLRYTSPIIRGGSGPIPISVELRGAKMLELEVDFADRADQLDHANWLNARLIR